MSFEFDNNRVYLFGKVASKPEFSHEVYGEEFYDINLKVDRLSSQFDLIPVTISDRLVKSNNLDIGQELAVIGQFRSYNKMINEKSRLLLTVFAREIIEPIQLQNSNIIELTGYLCKEPIYRTTPFKREICDCLIAVNRAYNKSDYLPCITWGRNARFVSGLAVGEKLYLTGRIQSRVYQKRLEDDQVEDRIAYEVSVSKVSREDNLQSVIKYYEKLESKKAVN
ncbi:MAG: single-stranded DNA-binding protein [Clostridia bacterium]|nr:single-stranded DNA-binding protein [Clostridia bacterium]